MFPTFTGSSRRPRNVNLSGQTAANPFAARSWSPSSSSGTSKALADVQAERRQRQQERDRLKAAQSFQRIWRGHRARRELREFRRRAFDDLYASPASLSSEQKLASALPLILAAFEVSCAGDVRRLELLVQDLTQTGFSPVRSGQIDARTLERLAGIIIQTLESNVTTTPANLLTTLITIIGSRPEAIVGVLDRYYLLLAKYCAQHGSGALAVGLQRAAIAPLVVMPDSSDTFTLQAYRAFAVSFLTTPNMTFFEQNPGLFSEDVNMDTLSSSIVEAFATDGLSQKPSEDLLWLLAHFIALHKAQTGGRRSPAYVKALYLQLSNLSTDVKLLSLPRESEGSVNGFVESPYLRDAIKHLVDKEEVTDVLEKFTSNYGHETAQAFEDASVLAGYILTLIRCFPQHSDDIRMRLYLADILSNAGKVPSVKFFWNAMNRTTVFSKVVSDERSCLNFLQTRKYFQSAGIPGGESAWEREWRTVLLFLELYVFVLRLTDDDDFFGLLGQSGARVEATTSRLRSCGLHFEDIKQLTIFLKNLAFTLYYNAASLLPPEPSNTTALNGLFGFSSSAKSRRDKKGSTSKQSAGFSVIPGIDFGAFRGIVTTAMLMLYERDSRRRFLPQDHWLMTAKFDMEGFIDAVVAEEERQHELQAEEEDEESEESGDDDSLMEGGDYRPFTSWEHQRRSQHARMELMKQRRKAQRGRMLAVIGPKLEILRNMPFAIPFETRVQIFRRFVYLDKYRRRHGYVDNDQWRLAMNPNSLFNPDDGTMGRHSAKIRRGKLFQDALDHFYGLGEGLKEPISITFVDKFGSVEAGIDGGGVTKEFLISVTKEAFAENLGLFVTNSQNFLYPNPCAVDQRQEKLREADIVENSHEWNEHMAELMEEFEFLGRIVGKCLYEGILIDVAFAGFFLLKWSSTGADTAYRANINDLREMDEQLYQGMLSLKNYPGDVSDLALDFTITDQVSMPGEEPVRTATRNLMPNGDKVTVTNENRPLYISYVARHRLVKQPFHQTSAFLRGLGAIISPAWLSMFNQSELQRLVGGDMTQIDVEDLRRNTAYGGAYQIGDDGQEHPTVRLFWQVMHTLGDTERRDVLKYVTSSPRAPLLGFNQLSPHFTIRDGGLDQERLPSASTCVNLLKLPQYQTAEMLRAKLLYAVSSNAGFDLS